MIQKLLSSCCDASIEFNLDDGVVKGTCAQCFDVVVEAGKPKSLDGVAPIRSTVSGQWPLPANKATVERFKGAALSRQDESGGVSNVILGDKFAEPLW